MTSLPSRFGTGDLGPEAANFVTALGEAGQVFWQVLPLHPTHGSHHHSPYHATSLFAFNPLLISPEVMVQDGIIDHHQLAFLHEPERPGAGFLHESLLKVEFLRDAARQNHCGQDDPGFERFRSENQSWLGDYALFSAIARTRGTDWSAWPEGIRDREPAVLETQRQKLARALDEEQYIQYLAFSQWGTLHGLAREQGIRIIGDLPFYPAYESADVWSHRDLFRLDGNGRPCAVAGVPPDYFSRTGQWWGNPVYRWEEIERQDFSWWVERVEHLLGICDCLRVDHFRGLQACWEIPAGAATAQEGSWVRGPGPALLSPLAARFPSLPLIAEDLGTITPDVRDLMAMFSIPGMRVLQFGFDGDPKNPHAPAAISEDVVLYTGTHDNNTVRGWFENEASREDKRRLSQYLGREVPAANVHLEVIRLAMMSVANTAIIPMQDILGLGGEARMNKPAKKPGNWRWRLKQDQLTDSIKMQLREMTEIYGRAIE